MAKVYLVTKACPPEPGEDVIAVALTLVDARDAVHAWAGEQASRTPMRPLYGKDKWETADGFWEVEITGWKPHIKRT